MSTLSDSLRSAAPHLSARELADMGPLAPITLDPLAIIRLAGMEPDPWQTGVLDCEADKVMLLGGRQIGKSLVCSALALRTMILEEGALVLVISPSDRQSGEFVRKAKSFFYSLPRGNGIPEATADSALQLHLDNGSRLIGLPDSEGRVRGYSGVKLLFLEEASRVPDQLYHACTPMLAVSKGRQVALSTAFGKMGWYFDAWEKDSTWRKFKVTADQCPRITPAFLASEKRAMPERWFLQEYYCEFLDPEDAVFNREDIEAMEDPTLKPLLNWSTP